MQGEISSKKRNHFEFQRKFPRALKPKKFNQPFGMDFRGEIRLAHQCAWDPELGDLVLETTEDIIEPS